MGINGGKWAWKGMGRGGGRGSCSRNVLYKRRINKSFSKRTVDKKKYKTSISLYSSLSIFANDFKTLDKQYKSLSCIILLQQETEDANI